MKCEIYIAEDLIGKVSFTITDLTMGGIMGNLISNDNYKKYQKEIQKHTSEKGISNSNDFNFRIITENKIELKPSGGIGIIDSEEFNELYVESAGIDLSLFEK